MQKNPSQTPIHLRDTEDERILKSDSPRAFLTITQNQKFPGYAGCAEP